MVEKMIIILNCIVITIAYNIKHTVYITYKIRIIFILTDFSYWTFFKRVFFNPAALVLLSP